MQTFSRRAMVVLVLVSTVSVAHGAERTLPAEIDAATTAPDAEYGTSIAVDGALGAFRQVGSNQYDRVAYFFQTEAMYDLIKVTLSYPDDKPRMAELSLVSSNEIDGGDYQSQGPLGTGYVTGFTFELTRQIKELTCYFFAPHGRRFALILTTLKKDAPAALGRLKVERVDPADAGVLDLPADARVPGRRRLGMFWEDPVLAQDFGVRLMPRWSEAEIRSRFAAALERQMHYMQRIGHRAVVYPIVWYLGSLYQPSPEYFQGEIQHRLHPADFDKMMAAAYGKAGIAFWPSVRNWSLPSLAPLVKTAAAIQAGTAGDYVNTVSRSGEVMMASKQHRVPYLNSLHPAVRQANRQMVADILDRVGSTDSFAGIAWYQTIHSYPGFGDADHSFDDTTMKRFAQQKGLTLPVSSGAERFATWYAWVKAKHWTAFLDWRRDQQTEAFKELAAMIVAKKPGAKLRIMVLYPIPTREIGGRVVEDTTAYYREVGLDVATLAADPAIEITRIIRPHFYLNKLRSIAGTADATLLTRQERNFDLSWQAPFAKMLEGTVLQYDYFEYDLSKAGIPKLALPADWKTSEQSWHDASVKGGARNAMAAVVRSIATFDARMVDHGGFCIGPQGMEALIHPLAATFQSLPDVRFDETLYAVDGVVARAAFAEGRHWLYLVNATDAPRTIDLQVDFAATLGRLGLEQGRVAVAPDKPLRVGLRPYDLVAWKSVDSADAPLPDAGAQNDGAFAPAPDADAGAGHGADAQLAAVTDPPEARGGCQVANGDPGAAVLLLLLGLFALARGRSRP